MPLSVVRVKNRKTPPPPEWEIRYIKPVSNMLIPIDEDELPSGKKGWKTLYDRTIYYYGSYSRDKIFPMLLFSFYRYNDYDDIEYHYEIFSFDKIGFRNKKVRLDISGVLIAKNVKDYLKEVIQIILSIFRSEL